MLFLLQLLTDTVFIKRKFLYLLFSYLVFQVIRSGAESPNPLITWLPPSATRAHPEAMQGLSKSHFNSINSGVAERGLLLVARDVPITPITQEIPRILGALCQERRQRPNIYFLLHHRYVPYNRDQEAMACGQNPAHSCFGMACMLRVFTFSNTYSKQKKKKKEYYFVTCNIYINS